MAIGNFDACIDFTLKQEGGYSTDQGDPGNWTGGAVGSGTFGGTNFGISAAAYPTLDIKNLTREAAEAIYQRDYWQKLGCASLAAGVDLVVQDFGVNAGVSRSTKTLQGIVGVVQDGDVGPATIDAAGKIPAAQLIGLLTAAHEHFYDTMRDAPRYAAALDGRAERAKTAALAMLPSA
jgi:lysozyme family protein